MSKRRKVPLDARPAEEIAATVRAQMAPTLRVGDFAPNPSPGEGGEMLIFNVTADGHQGVPMSMVAAILGALEIRKARGR